jgi:hypothetical protein
VTSYEKSSLTQAVLAVIAQRLLLKSATELFHTLSAAQPAHHKRLRATDKQMDSFTSDLRARAPELTAGQIAELCADDQRPSLAQLDALRVLADMKPRDVPDHPGPPVRLPIEDEASLVAWTTVMDLARHRRQGWTLVGGQMVHLLAWEHGEDSPRVTTDADVVINVRAYPKALAEFTTRLLTAGYHEDGVSPEGMGFRTVTGARTIAVPGSVQALERSLRRKVNVNGTEGVIIRPDVHAAMVLKAAAYQDEFGKSAAERHLRDFAVLVSLYARHYPVAELAERLTKKDRSRIATALGSLPADNPIWRTVADGVDARELVRTALKPGRH